MKAILIILWILVLFLLSFFHMDWVEPRFRTITYLQYLLWKCLRIILGFYIEFVALYLALFSLWVFFFWCCLYLGKINYKWPTFEFLFGDIYLYHWYRKEFIINFGANEKRQPQNACYTKKNYSDFFFKYIARYLELWRELKSTAFIFNRFFTISFSLMVFWHFYLLDFIPADKGLNAVYLILVFSRKLLCLVVHMGTINIVNPLKLHEYEIAMYFSPCELKKAKTQKLVRFMPILFSFLLFTFFIALAVVGVYLCSFRIRDGIIVFFV